MTADLRAGKSTVRGLIAPAAALACLLSWAAHPVQAQLACGDTIPPGGDVSLDGDIDGCLGPEPALTIEGPVKVNLHGFRISCAADIIGIEVIGDHARITNGTVANCTDGIELSGEGRHKVFRMQVTSDPDAANGSRGFRVVSDRNYLVANLARRFNGEGFRIQGSDNRIAFNVARRNADHGFRVDEDRNLLSNNISVSNGAEGFRLDGSDNRLVDNIAFNNQDEGFRIRDGQDNVLLGNRARRNGASDNEAGIRIHTNGNTLRGNRFIDNFGNGILVTAGAANNQIVRNSARANRETDLIDENLEPPCDANQWIDNRFGSTSQDCIK